MRRYVFAVTVLSGLAGCSTEPTTLIITLDAVPAFVRAPSIGITGTVTRTPAGESTIIVTAQGGQSAATDTAGTGGASSVKFSVSVNLVANRENTIELVATDAKGAASAPETVVVRHDNQAPRIVSMTPPNQSDGAPTTGTIEITFNEPLVFGSAAAARLATSGQTIAAQVTLTADSLGVIVTPQADRRPNSVYVVEFDDIEDAAGNPIGVTEPACFVTVVTDPNVIVTDPADDYLQSQGATGASPADIVGGRLAVTQGLLTGVAQFTTPRSYNPDAVNNLLLYLEIDIDRDPNTGVESIRDFVLANAPDVEPSGLAVEYVIGIDPETLPGPSFLGRYTEFASFDVLDEFDPAFCGAFVGFRTSVANFGGDDGDFGFSLLALNLETETTLVADPSPDAGHHTAGFVGAFGTSVAPTAVSGGATRAVDLRRLGRPFPR